MNEFFSDIRIQQSLLLLVISFCLAVIIFGILIYKTKMFSGSIKNPYTKKSIGKVMIVVAALIAFTCILGLIFSYS